MKKILILLLMITISFGSTFSYQESASEGDPGRPDTTLPGQE